MHTIRDTIDPTREREVSDEEFLDLERQNIVLTGTRARTPEGLRAAAVRQVEEGLRGAIAVDALPETADSGAGEVVDEDQAAVPVPVEEQHTQTSGQDPVDPTGGGDVDDYQQES